MFGQTPRTVSRRCALAAIFAAAVAACSSTTSKEKPGEPAPHVAPRTTEAAWWCWGDGLCFPTREMCRTRAGQIGTDSTCVARPRAHCRHGCDVLDDGKVSCSESCVADRATCADGLGRDHEEPCVDKPVPTTRAALYPSYLKPGWWCWEATAPNGGHGSGCEKYPLACERARSETSAASGVPIDPCRAHEREVVCYELELVARQETHFHCFTQAADCEAARPQAVAHGRDIGMTVHGACTPWAHD